MSLEIRDAGIKSRWTTGIVREDGAVLASTLPFRDAEYVRLNLDGRSYECPGLAAYHADANVGLIAVNWGSDRPPPGLRFSANAAEVGQQVYLMDYSRGEPEPVQVVTSLERAPWCFHTTWPEGFNMWTQSDTGGAFTDDAGNLVGLFVQSSATLVGPRGQRLTAARPAVLAQLRPSDVTTWFDWRTRRLHEIEVAKDYVKRADAAFRANDAPKARSLAASAVASDTRSAYAWTTLGRSLMHLEEHAQAADALDRAIELTPDDPYAYSMRACALARIGRIDEAFDDVDCAIALSPSNGFAHECRGFVLQVAEKYDEAVLAYEEAVRLDPNRRAAADELQRLKAWLSNRDH